MNAQTGDRGTLAMGTTRMKTAALTSTTASASRRSPRPAVSVDRNTWRPSGDSRAIPLLRHHIRSGLVLRQTTVPSSGNTPADELLRGRKGEEEDTALAGLGGGPGPTAVALDDFSDDRQPHPGPRVFLLAMQALEDTEDPLVVLHVEADAAIGDADHHLVPLDVGAQGDHAPSLWAELHGVGDQIGQRLAEAFRLARNL